MSTPQPYVPGPAAIWVGTVGTLGTRVCFPANDSAATGANAVVKAVDAKGGITTVAMADGGSGFTTAPSAVAVGGGFGYIRQGTVAGGAVTGVTTPSFARWGNLAEVGNPDGSSPRQGKGMGYKACSSDFAFELLGYTESGVLMESAPTPMPIMGDWAANTPVDDMFQGMAGRINFAIKDYDKAVLERMMSRCAGGSSPGSACGIVGTNNSVCSAGSLAIANFKFFPMVVLAPYATAAPKSSFYGSMRKGIHIPAATIASMTDPYSVRVRRVQLAVNAHWVADPFTLGGILFDYAVDCLAAGP